MSQPSKPRRTEHVVAVSWHHDQFLAMVARISPRGIEIVDVMSFQLEADSSVATIGTRVKESLERLRIKRFRLVIGLPRSSLEMVPLKLPPATDAELPVMVRHEVARQLPELPDDALIDYYTTPDDDPSARAIEAAVLRAEQFAQVTEFADAVGQPPSNVVLRTLAIASLFSRLAGHAHPKSLLLNVMERDIDVSVFVRQRVLFSRTVRWGRGSAEAEQGTISEGQIHGLVDEIRRTIAAVPLDSDDSLAIEHVYMFGDLQADNDLIKSLAEELDTPVSLLDPLVGLQLHEGIDRATVSRLPALIGILRDAADDAAVIDFANPKQPPPPHRHIRKIAFYAAASLALLLIGVWHFGSKLHEAKQARVDAEQELKEVEGHLAQLRRRTAAVDAVSAWRSAEIHWLNELARLSLNFPSSEEAVIGRLTAAPAAGGVGVVSMSVRVSKPEVIDQLETSLRDDRHQVSSKRISQSSAQGAFPCQFDTSLVIKPFAAVDAATATSNPPSSTPASNNGS